MTVVGGSLSRAIHQITMAGMLVSTRNSGRFEPAGAPVQAAKRDAACAWGGRWENSSTNISFNTSRPRI